MRLKKRKNIETPYGLAYSHLAKVSYWKILFNLFVSAWALFYANTFAGIVQDAAEGKAALWKVAALMAIVAVYSFLKVVIKSNIEKKAVLCTQKCKISFYRKYFSQPLWKFESSSAGEAVQHFEGDLQQLAGWITDTRVGLWTGALSVGIYMLYLGSQSVVLAVLMAFFACIQVIPPFIVEHYLDRFYVENQEVEAKITEKIISGYKNLAGIKIFHLQKWYLEQLWSLIKRSVKIGMWNQVALQAEDSLTRLLESILKYGSIVGVGLLVYYGRIPLGAGVMAISLSGTLFGQVNICFSAIPERRLTRTAQKRLEEWFAQYQYAGPAGGVTQISLGPGYKVSQGGKYAVVGENGAGKTVLMKKIMGILEDAGKEIRIEGELPVQLQDEYRNENIVYLPQEDPSFSITAYELYQNAVPGGAEGAVREAEEFGISDKMLKDIPICKLSGGERKKVYLALAFALKRRWMILDEPSNNLDRKGQEVLKRKIMEANAAVIYVTHDLALAETADDLIRVGKEHGNGA